MGVPVNCDGIRQGSSPERMEQRLTAYESDDADQPTQRLGYVCPRMRLQGAHLPTPRGLTAAYDFSKVAKALEIVEEIRAAGEKVIVFTSLRGLYRTLEAAFKDRCIPYVGVDGGATGKRNDVIRRFEAGNATVLLVGTGTLNRGSPSTGPTTC
jgi:hypothetical protein